MTPENEGQTMSYEDLNVEQLKDMLRDRELPVSGTKPELIERLLAHDAEVAEDEAEQEAAAAREADAAAPHESAAAGEGQAFNAGVVITYADPATPADDDEVLEDDAPVEMLVVDLTGTEADPTIEERRAADLARWREENPDANVIPPALLPREYLDGMINTPGQPD